MPFQDTSSITGGNEQTIADWNCGDDRIFSGKVSGLASSDPDLTDAYFTLKLNPNDPDAEAIVQKHITQTATAAGQITGSPFNELLIHVYSGDYEGLVQPGTSYWWDFRVITTGDSPQGASTITVATGQVAFLQQVTQTNEAGTPAAAPNFGQPRWRGFLATHPKAIAGFVGNFNPGDVYFNSQPVVGGPSGWICLVACTDSSGWVSNGIVQDD